MLIIFFILIFLFYYIKMNVSKERSYYFSTITFVSIAYVFTELFSLFYVLDYKHLFGAYCVCSIVLGIFIFWGRANAYNKISNLFKDIKNLKSDKIRILFIIIFVAMFILALITVPYNWDSMTYHLSRIAHWTQNKSVAHYAANDVRQLTSPVLAEFINLHVYILCHKQDTFFNLVQNISFVTNASLVYFITKKIANERVINWLSVLLFVSMPIAFSEALTTQVDHFSTMWLLMFVYFILDIIDSKHKLTITKQNITYVIVLSCCIGYGYLAKPSIMFGVLFFAIWLLGVCICRKDKVKDILGLILIAVVIISVIIMPEIMRNIVTFNAISDPIAGSRQLIGTLKPHYMFINGLKNYAMNIPNMYIDCADIVETGVFWLAYKLGVNINDPTIAEDGKVFYLHEVRRYGCDTAINPVIGFFTIFVIIHYLIYVFKRKKYTVKDMYSMVSVSLFLVFCCFLRWEPFVTRYMLSYLALLCPVIAIWVSQIRKVNCRSGVIAIIIFLCSIELMGLFDYHIGKYISQNQKDNKVEKYFEGRDGEFAYIDLINLINQKNYKNIGLYIGGDTYEYPIWAQCKEGIRFENICVKNNSSRYADESFIPEAIVVINNSEDEVKNYNGYEFECVETFEDFVSLWELE